MSATNSKPIPTILRAKDGTQIPGIYSSTPSGTIYGTTPGGTRIVYNREQLLQLASSPLSRSPPNMKHVDGITKGTSPRKEVVPAKKQQPETILVDDPFEMDL